ncbi:MAG: response regulator [Chloroflexi bacterium]|nr:response regulator [Chloroflexota bacterium]MBU1748478.1 response regulator [Chloroflexota bacterium]
MANERILVVDDEPDISNLLRVYFKSRKYEVLVASRGAEALEICRRQMPQVIVLDINLPDMSGFDVCQSLRENLRTSHIPIIFLTQRDQRSDKIAGLESGADDYITKPFDIQELHLRVQNSLRRAGYESLTNPVTGLPGSKLIEQQFRELLQRDSWALLYLGLENFVQFNETYGFVAGDDILKFVALVLGNALDELGSPGDFLGHTGGADFLVIVSPERADVICESILSRLERDLPTFYSFADRERGYITQDRDGQMIRVPLMCPVLGRLISPPAQFTSVREISEAAAETRQRAPRRPDRQRAQSSTHTLLRS